MFIDLLIKNFFDFITISNDSTYGEILKNRKNIRFISK